MCNIKNNDKITPMGIYHSVEEIECDRYLGAHGAPPHISPSPP